MGAIKYGKKSIVIDSGNKSTIQEVEVLLCKKIKKTYRVTVTYACKSSKEVEAKRFIIEDIIKRASKILKE